MTNNANIQARLIDLLNILDARAVVSVYKLEPDRTQMLINSNEPVWKLLSFYEEHKAFRLYEVVGLNIGLSDRILIRKAES